VSASGPHNDDEPDEEAERRRLYNLGGLAQSYPPRGVADLLKVPASRATWSERSRRERFQICAILAIETALAAVVIAGVATRSAALVLGGAGAFLFLLLGTAFLTVRSEVRRQVATGQRRLIARVQSGASREQLRRWMHLVPATLDNRPSFREKAEVPDPQALNCPAKRRSVARSTGI
jgi:hypothetical protein